MTPAEIRSAMVDDQGRWRSNVIHWPRLIGGVLEGHPAPLTPFETRRVVIPQRPELDEATYGHPVSRLESMGPRMHHYDRRILASDGATFVVGLAATELDTDAVRLLLMLSHPGLSVG